MAPVTAWSPIRRELSHEKSHEEAEMSHKTAALASCIVAITVCLPIGSTLAQPADKRTIFTFSAPVAVPDATLPPGKYLFRLADSASRNVIQVLTADGKQPRAQFFAMRSTRPEPAKEPEVRFMETAAGMPLAIRAWWYPGERTGYEFVYPKDQARQLAMEAKDPVLTTQAETTTVHETGTGELTRVSGSGAHTNAGDGRTPTMPTGAIENGEIAAETIVMAIFPAKP